MIRITRRAKAPAAARAADLFKGRAEAAVLGMTTPEAAMPELVRPVAPLLG